MAPWRCRRIFSNLDGGWLGVLKGVVFLGEWRWRCRKLRLRKMRKEKYGRGFKYMSNVMIEYDMICIHVCILLRYMYIYTYTHMLLHVDQNVSESEMIKLYTTYAVNIIQWMRMMMACM